MTIERRYAALRQQQQRATAADLLALAKRAQRHAANVQTLTQSRTRARKVSLERAVSRMHGDELDAAWREALRGDYARAVSLVADHVAPVRLERTQGSPWREWRGPGDDLLSR